MGGGGVGAYVRPVSLFLSLYPDLHDKKWADYNKKVVDINPAYHQLKNPSVAPYMYSIQYV